jgi:uncharacterized protein (TIGR03000 family)
MRRVLALFTSCWLVAPVGAQVYPGGDRYFPDGYYGGIVFIRQGGESALSVGGALLPRRVKVTTATPDGPIVTRFAYPSPFHSPRSVWPLPHSAPAQIRVEIPDAAGVLYLNGDLTATRGEVRQLESPPLPPGQAFPLRLRGAFVAGDKILIEDRNILMYAGECVTVRFDGTSALAVPLPKRDGVEVAPPPRKKVD